MLAQCDPFRMAQSSCTRKRPAAAMASTESCTRKRPAAATASTEGKESYPGDCQFPAGIKAIKLRSVKAFHPAGPKEPKGRCLPPHPRSSFEENGENILASWIAEVLGKLDSYHRDVLMARFQRTASQKKPRTLGTLCSGTDAPVLVYKAVRIASHRFGGDFAFETEFSCDRDPKVRLFLRTMFGEQEVKKLFKECSEVASSTRKAPDDLKDGGDSEVPSVMDLVAGFPCKDVSSLLRSVENNRSVIRNGAKRSGGVFANILEYLREHDESIESVMLENVVGLLNKGPDEVFSNLDWCVALLEALGFWVYVFKLDPRLLGMPVARMRICIIAVKKQILLSGGMDSTSADELARQLMQRIVDGQQWRHLEDFLLPENHPSIRELQRRTSTRLEKKGAGKGKGKVPAWPEKYARFVQKGKGKGTEQWWQPVQPCEGIMQTFPGLRRLTDRHLSILAAHGMNVRSEEALCLRSNRTLEVSQEVARTRPSPPGQASIVLPRGELYLESRVRLAHGHEGLLMQGLHFGNSHCCLRNWSSDALMTLAGNAFNSWCMAAAFVVKECVLGVAQDNRSKEQHDTSSASSQTAASAWRHAKSHTLSDILKFDEPQ